MRLKPASLAWILGVGLLALTGLLFWPCAGFDFLEYDDCSFVKNNIHVHGLSWANLRWAVGTVHLNWWLPVLWISYMIDGSLYGPGPAGYHVTNVLLHALNGALLFALLWRMTRRPWASAFAAALFAWHPMRVESVAWISERKDVLSTLFLLLAAHAGLAYARRPRAAAYALVAILFALGNLAKTMLVMFPILLLILDYWPLRRMDLARPWRSLAALGAEKIPLLLMSAFFAGLTLYTHVLVPTDGEPPPAASMQVATLLPRVTLHYALYLKHTLWPFGLGAFYPEPEPAGWWPWLPAMGLLLAVTALVWRLRRRRPAAWAGWLWFVVALVPASGLIPVGATMLADRYTYVPSMGLAMLAAWGVGPANGPSRRSWRWLFAAAAVAALAVLAWGTHQYLPVWRNTTTLFVHTQAVTENNVTALINAGASLAAGGRPAEALPLLEKAFRLDPMAPETACNLAMVLKDCGRDRDALTYFLIATRVRPTDPVPFFWAGVLYARQAQWPDAIRYLQETARLRPDDPEALGTLGKAWLRAGQPREAVAALQAAREKAVAGGRADLAARLAADLAAAQAQAQVP